VVCIFRTVELKKNTANTVPLLFSSAGNMTHTKIAKYKVFFVKIYFMIFSCQPKPLLLLRWSLLTFNEVSFVIEIEFCSVPKNVLYRLTFLFLCSEGPGFECQR
jgi:hypothetical protein